jgi:hypothetical protein
LVLSHWRDVPLACRRPGGIFCDSPDGMRESRAFRMARMLPMTA